MDDTTETIDDQSLAIGVRQRGDRRAERQGHGERSSGAATRVMV